MKLAARQLQAHLGATLANAYLVSGEEPLLAAEAAEQIRSAARRQGFEQRDLHFVERGFKWAELQAHADNLSLFATRRIVELRLPSARPGEAGARVIRALSERPDPDRLLLVVSGKLDASAARSTWAKSIEQTGVWVQVWPIERNELPQWIHARAARLELKLTRDAAELLADRVEGNLLAAAQELQKLALIDRGGDVDEQAVLAAVANSARFDVFRLTDAVLAREPRRAIAILDGLRSEGVEPVLVLWALSRELGLLARLKFAVLHGESVDRALSLNGVWRRRQPLLKDALQRFEWDRLTLLLAQAAEVDNMIKGVIAARPWDGLTRLVVAALGCETPRASATSG